MNANTSFPLTGRVKRWLWRRGFVDGRKGIQPQNGTTRITKVITFWYAEVVAKNERMRDEELAKLDSEERSIPVLRSSREQSLAMAETTMQQLLEALPVAPDPATRAVPGSEELKMALLLAKARRELNEKMAHEEARIDELRDQLDNLKVRADQVPAAKEAVRDLTEDLIAGSRAHANRQIAYYGAALARWHKDRQMRNSDQDLTYL